VPKTNLNRDRGWKHSVTNGTARFEIWGENAIKAIKKVLQDLTGVDVSFHGRKIIVRTNKRNQTAFQRIINALRDAPTSASA
jgi:hypothetical protein